MPNTSIKLFPNPCREYFIVEKNDNLKNINEINIYNLKGKLIKRNFTKYNPNKSALHSSIVEL